VREDEDFNGRKPGFFISMEPEEGRNVKEYTLFILNQN